jgi:hypothetical protein
MRCRGFLHRPFSTINAVNWLWYHDEIGVFLSNVKGPRCSFRAQVVTRPVFVDFNAASHAIQGAAQYGSALFFRWQLG